MRRRRKAVTALHFVTALLKRFAPTVRAELEFGHVYMKAQNALRYGYTFFIHNRHVWAVLQADHKLLGAVCIIPHIHIGDLE